MKDINTIFADSVERNFPIHDERHARALLATMTMYPVDFKRKPRFKLILKNLLNACKRFNIEIKSAAFREFYLTEEQFVFR